MRIIIAGAGDVGFHLAELLTKENQDIVLIDTNKDVLDYAESHLDVLTIWGDSTSIGILKQASPNQAQLLLAVTTSENSNILTAILAKKMGIQKTIARVTNKEYLEDGPLHMFKDLGVDHLISPRQLAVLEINRLIRQCSFTDIFEFEDGKLSLVGLTLDGSSPLISQKVSHAGKLLAHESTKPIAILRGQRTLIPTADTVLRENDHVYFITRSRDREELTRVIGKKLVTVRHIMILGGGGLAKDTAQVLEKNYKVTLIEKSKERCKDLAESLDHTLVINGDYSNMDLLVEEGLEQMDAFIAVTTNSETNIIACLAAKNHGVRKTIAQVENKEYVHISQNIGVDTLINRKLIAANNIFRYVRKGRVEAITSLNGVDAEVIEFVLSEHAQVTGQNTKELKIPKGSMIGGVIRGDQSLIPNGDFQFQSQDKVIVFALPEAIDKLERLFN